MYVTYSISASALWYYLYDYMCCYIIGTYISYNIIYATHTNKHTDIHIHARTHSVHICYIIYD